MTLQLDAVHCGDALAVLQTLPDECVNTIVTSPPYFGLRDYGVDGQIGLEESVEAYVEALVSVFHEAHRVLRSDGTLWLNLGDSYVGSTSQHKDGGSQGANSCISKKTMSGVPSSGRSKRNKELYASGLGMKQLIGIPWRVAFALQADGWILRSDIVWQKPNPMPESVKDRPTKAHEYVFLFAKCPKYYYDADAIKEPAKDWGERDRSNGKYTSGEVPIKGGAHKGLKGLPKQNTHKNMAVPGRKPHSMHAARVSGKNELLGKRQYAGFNERWDNRDVPLLTRNKRTVWTVATRALDEAHFAAFPPKLIEPMILAGCPAGGVVLDMFFGAGTTGLVARGLGRHFVGVELNPAYVALAEKRLAAPYTLPMLEALS